MNGTDDKDEIQLEVPSGKIIFLESAAELTIKWTILCICFRFFFFRRYDEFNIKLVEDWKFRYVNGY